MGGIGKERGREREGEREGEGGGSGREREEAVGGIGKERGRREERSSLGWRWGLTPCSPGLTHLKSRR